MITQIKNHHRLLFHLWMKRSVVDICIRNSSCRTVCGSSSSIRDRWPLLDRPYHPSHPQQQQQQQYRSMVTTKNTNQTTTTKTHRQRNDSNRNNKSSPPPQEDDENDRSINNDDIHHHESPFIVPIELVSDTM